ncbi:polysaccharide biosynthesis protein [Nitrospira lenta]|uniref:Capsular polysaccharide biosynthesis protein CapD n=1 Tax=Nitrospira lenta TaxID=1436998 RepID=A0A330LF37_9BACT|nr:nucleoside-diphosphate sugar epimerase/dehydratase [Nitrospira lenta]SPP65618.1 Capsular polysaccharide biosynthesis protein CapD [Nitrospira lenta]
MRRIATRVFHTVAGKYGQLVMRFRSLLVVATHLGLIVAAHLTAFVLRFEGDIHAPFDQMMWRYLPAVLVIYWGGLRVFGIQRGLWRYVGLHDLGRIFWATLTGSVAFFLIFHVGLGWPEYPRSIIILTGLLSGFYIAGIRLAVRWFREWLQIVAPTVRRVLIVGAGHAGELLARDMLSDPSFNSRPVGFIDDDPVKRKMKIHGIPVVGTIEEIKSIADRLEAHEIIVALPSASTASKQRILAASEGCTAPIKILPNVRQLLGDPVSLQQVRPMRLEDLLQREPIQTDRQELHPLIEGKTVLVTGAGGSIGSELCRQIASYRPESLVLFERYENSLHALLLELRATFPTVGVLPIIGDVTVPERVAEVFRQTGPELVFHAAAHKHVPLMELNPKEAVRNNVLGTRIVAEAALTAGVDRFVLISTDKAVNPTSVMGVTKRIAEQVIQGFNHRGRTKYTVVRFGNVLGSNGSVVPLFAEQILKGGPITVTDPEIKRFFMTIPEAVQLVLQASVIGQGGDVFVLDMGEQIKIVDLARNMIVLSGLVPGKDIDIQFTGLRPGEKLYEELFDESEQTESTAHEKINRAVCPLAQADLDPWLDQLGANLLQWNEEDLLLQLRQRIPSFTPTAPQRVS